MRFVALPLVAALAAVASPAMADESRLEARGGIIWNGDGSDAVAGVAVGHDFDFGTNAFVGPEISADKILADNTRVSFGFGGRMGIKTSEASKLYGAASYNTKNFRYGDESWTLGAGYQQNFGGNLYGKVEYRHHFVDYRDHDTAVVGLGVRF